MSTILLKSTLLQAIRIDIETRIRVEEKIMEPSAKRIKRNDSTLRCNSDSILKVPDIEPNQALHYTVMSAGPCQSTLPPPMLSTGERSCSTTVQKQDYNTVAPTQDGDVPADIHSIQFTFSAPTAMFVADNKEAFRTTTTFTTNTTRNHVSATITQAFHKESITDASLSFSFSSPVFPGTDGSDEESSATALNMPKEMPFLRYCEHRQHLLDHSAETVTSPSPGSSFEFGESHVWRGNNGGTESDDDGDYAADYDLSEDDSDEDEDDEYINQSYMDYSCNCAEVEWQFEQRGEYLEMQYDSGMVFNEE